MDTLRGMLDGFLEWWRDLQSSSKVGLVAAVAATIAAMVGVGIWSSRPQYTTLANNLAPSEAAELVSKLDAEGIDNQLNFSASAVLVPKHQMSRARTLVGDRAVGGDNAEWNESILGDPGLNRFKMNRHLEQNLAASIRRMHGIADATVHISQPDKSPFIRANDPPTASVLIEYQQGAMASRTTAAAIVDMVANAVEGLTKDNVALSDPRGPINTGNNGLNGIVSGQLEYRQQVEATLAAKANNLLSSALGDRRSIVRVTADVDFTRTERKVTTYSDGARVPRKEEITSETTTGSGSQPSGAAGVNSIGIRGNRTTNIATQDTKNDKTIIEYDNGPTIDSIVEEPGKLLRLTIAVVADVTPAVPATDGEATDQDAPPPLLTQEQIEEIVKQATGFDEKRGDKITVVLSQLAGFQTEGEQLLKSQQWDFYERILRNSSLGIASLVALILGLLTLLRLRPITVTPAPERQPSELLSEFSEQVRDNPDVVKAVVSAWLDDDTADETEQKRAA